MRNSSPTLAGVVLLLFGAFSAGLVASQLDNPVPLPDWLPWGQRAGAATPGTALGPSEPVRIAIPSLAVDAPIYPVGLDDNGAIAAPPLEQADQTGWYEDGPAPGQFGAAIIVGHVDDREGPAVFYGIGDLPPGSRIEISRQDGRMAVFEVTAVRTYPKERLPPDEVYGDFREPELRLITCGGEWVGGEAGYADSVIVFATLIDP
jgi:hypothetical protein